MFGIGFPELIVIFVAGALIVPPFWRIFSKLHVRPWLSFLVLIPLINLSTLWVIAFMPIVRVPPGK